MRTPTNSMNALSLSWNPARTDWHAEKVLFHHMGGGKVMRRAPLPKAMNQTTESIVLLSGLRQILVFHR